MIKKNITLATLILAITAGSLLANPMSLNYTSAPEPVYGMKALKEQATYPSLAKDLGVNGYVEVKFHIDVVGNISDVQIARSGGAPFDQSAISAVLSTDWNPAMQNGKAVAVTYTVPFEFRAK